MNFEGSTVMEVILWKHCYGSDIMEALLWKRFYENVFMKRFYLVDC